MKKRGLSTVVAVTILILITIVAAMIILGFVLPFTTENLDSSKQCLDISGGLSFAQTPYNCYAESYDHDNNSFSPAIDRTAFSVRIDNEKIIGFRVALYSGGDSKVIEILEGSNPEGTPDIAMLNENPPVFTNPLEVPKRGEVRSYVAISKFTKVEIAPIIESGDSCSESEELELEKCGSFVSRLFNGVPE